MVNQSVIKPERVIVRQPTYTAVETFRPFDKPRTEEFTSSVFRPIVDNQHTQWVTKPEHRRKRK